MRRYLIPFAILVLTAVVLVWAWWRLPARKGHTPATVQRAAYDGSQALRLAVLPNGADEASERLQTWLRDEIDHWLAHARVRYDRGSLGHAADTFTLQVTTPNPTQLRLRLIAPDGAVAREQSVALQPIGLPFATTLTHEVPRFLHLQENWEASIGTRNAAHYETVARVREHLRDDALGARPSTGQRTVTDIDALEQVTREESAYARAWSTLALSYSRMKGEDADSLETLAVNAAEHAIALDPQNAEAQAVRGSVQYRRSQWLAAHEQLTRALQLQPVDPMALGALACLLVDAGMAKEALPIAERAAVVSPMDGEARECLSYARADMGKALVESRDASLPFAAARVVATVQILDGHIDAASETYAAALGREHLDAPWVAQLLNAARDHKQSVEALRAITSAASDKTVDPSTEVLAGLALQRSEFVLNRLARLQSADTHAPLRVLWLPQAKHIRLHAGFDEVIRASNLATFWARHGKPDICEAEPDLALCR